MGASASSNPASDGKYLHGSAGAGLNPPNLNRSTKSRSTEAKSAASHADQLVGGIPREKKKKMTGFATLRRKLIRRRRTSKSFDHGKVMREFVADWSCTELGTLVEEYEATAALKDLSVQADLARPPASTHKQDLSDLFDYKYASDVTLVFQGACFPAHRTILSARCSYFRDLLSAVRQQHGVNSQVHVDSLLQSRGIDVPTFAALLRYLYTGDFCLESEAHLSADETKNNLDILIRLGQEFGTPNPLETDLRYLMETGDLADAVLVFASGQDFTNATVSTGKTISASGGGSNSSSSSSGPASDYGFFPWLEIPCHRAILSARSPFFRSLIQRRLRTASEAAGTTPGSGVVAASGPLRIVLDESVIPRRYARVLMQALYLDTVDMNCIVRPPPVQQPVPPIAQQVTQQQATIPAASDEVLTTATVPAVQPRPAPPSLFEEATELYQIGRFLELDILSQGCEDVLVDGLCLDHLPQVLRWSELPHGSSWVRRQALHLLREEFSAVAQAPVLLELDKAHLVEILHSDFLQASELEVLQSVLRWGEHQLVRRMEDREPNVVSQTAHSVARKGIRRRDLNDVELRDILSELLPFVRVDHVLPPNCECLAQAIRRGLVSTPPSHMIGGDYRSGGAAERERGEQLRLHAWIRGKNQGLYVKPRLFMPYFEESKSLLADSLMHQDGADQLMPSSSRFCSSRGMMMMSSVGQHHHNHHHRNIPDTLYMIDDALPTHPSSSGGLEPAVTSSTNDLDVVTGAVPVPDSETLQAMIRRERKLRSSPLSQRAYSLPLTSRRDVNRQIRLRVVREFNLPDSIAEELELAAYQFEDDDEEEEEDEESSVQQNPSLIWEQRKPTGTSVPIRVPVPPKRLTSSRPKLSDNKRIPSALDLPLDELGATGISPSSNSPFNQSQLSELIPDIAALSIVHQLAREPTGQIVNHFGAPLQPPEPYSRELQLDLGDGAAPPRLGSDWSIVRPPIPHLAQHQHPVRLSTFRTTDEPDGAHHWPVDLAPPHLPPHQGAAAAVAAAAVPGSPRTRSSRSSRAADVRVFI